MKKTILRYTAMVLLLSLVLAGCGSSPKKEKPSLKLDPTEANSQLTFGGTDTRTVGLSAEGAAALLEAIDAQQPDYIYSELYQLEEVKTRLDFDAAVEQHAYSALNSAGQLDAAHLAALVESNNAAYLQEHTFGYKAVESEHIREVCTLLVQVVGQMREKYPDMDWQRVYCNLGNLKILYNVGMLSYAQVNQEHVLSISENNTSIVSIMEGENGYRNVLIHETMHILQLGCSCEQIGNDGRRAGISVYWDDFLLNTTDWTWLVEGSAERNMCAITGGNAVSYQYKMDYICSFTMALLLREQVQPDTIQTLCFYDDPQLLFDAFGAETEEERDEVLKLLITMEVLQAEPSEFYRVLKEATGQDPKENGQVKEEFSFALKVPVCITLAREFYQNLAVFLQENTMPVDDLCFLLNLFEGHLNQHLNYNSEAKAQINEPFLASYRAMRQALFDALTAEDPELDMQAYYSAYRVTTVDGQLNGQLSWLPEEKREFLSERALWQQELLGLGQKVPME